LGSWYEDYAPKIRQAPNVWINGVKIFSERSVCGDLGIGPVFSADMLSHFTEEGLNRWGDEQLLLSHDELTQVIERADTQGYQVAIHAIGDLGIETSLMAIADALQGLRNVNRHMVLHNHFIRNDMFNLYSRSEIVALVEPFSPCQANSYVELVGENNRQIFKRWRDLTETEIHIALNSDWPYTGFYGLNPMR
jgi:predicted amidohydrolase YtcJ